MSQPDLGETFTMSVSEFTRIQTQMQQLKMENYDLKQRSEKEKKATVQSGISLRISKAKYEKEIKKLKTVISKSKQKMIVYQLQQKCEEYKRNLDNTTTMYKQQNMGLKKNVQLFLKENDKLKTDVETEKKEKEDLKKQILAAKKEKEEFKSKFIDALKEKKFAPQPIQKSDGNENEDGDGHEKGNIQKTEGEGSIANENNNFQIQNNEIQKELLKTIDEMKEKNEKLAAEKNKEIEDLQKEKQNLLERIEKSEKENKINSEKLEKLSVAFESTKKELEENKKKIVDNGNAATKKLKDIQHQLLNKKQEDLKKLELLLKKNFAQERQKIELHYKKKLDDLNLKKVSHQKKKRLARFQVGELQKRLQQEKAIKSAKIEEVKLLTKKSIEYENALNIYKKNSKNFTDALKREKETNKKLSSEVRKLMSLLKEYKKSLNQKNQQITRTTKELTKLTKEAELAVENCIKLEVNAIMDKLISKDEREKKEEYYVKWKENETELKKVKESENKLTEKNKELKKTNSDREANNTNLIKELVTHLKQLKKKEEDLNALLDEKDFELEALRQGKDVKEGNGKQEQFKIKKSGSLQSLKAKNRHIRKQSNEIIGGSESHSSYIQKLQNDNEMLITKLTASQQDVWNLMETKRVLETRLLQFQEDNTKKKTIISDYIKREKLGKLKSEINKNKGQIIQKKQSLMKLIFSKMENNSNMSASEQFDNQMEMLVEEALFTNIQAEKNIKILGQEVSRLLQENKSLKEMIRKISEK